MPALPHTRFFTADEYLQLEERAEYRSQYYYGEIFKMSDEVQGMAGASQKHNKISMNTSAHLHFQLRQKSCDVYQSDMRVKVNEDFYTYPDIVVVCGEAQIEKKNGESLINPTLLIEILSPSTQDFDRGEKARLYRLMPSLQEYVLISQDKAHIEHYAKQMDGKWILTELSAVGETLMLPAVFCELHLGDIYEKIDFTK
jgi:Uma2 family endonuclease